MNPMHRQKTINKPKGLAVTGIILCCLSVFFGVFCPTLAVCWDSLAYSLGVDEYSVPLLEKTSWWCKALASQVVL
jgi:hypothetical protein